MDFVGMKDGKATVFTPEELGAWICDKSTRGISLQNAKKCAEYACVHKGAGGGIKQKLDGTHSIFHISHGKRNSADGCTLFFSSRTVPAKHMVVVGIGWHRSDTEYDLDYKAGTWNVADRTLVKL